MWSGDATYGSKVETIFTYNYTGSYGIQASQYGQSGGQWNSKLVTLTYFDPTLFTFEFQKGSSNQLGKIWSVEEWQEPEITNLI